MRAELPASELPDAQLKQQAEDESAILCGQSSVAPIGSRPLQQQLQRCGRTFPAALLLPRVLGASAGLSSAFLSAACRHQTLVAAAYWAAVGVHREPSRPAAA